MEPGLVDGPGGTTALSVGAPLGRLTSAQWRLLARTAVAYGSGELRVTPWRGIVVPGRPAGEPSGPGAPARLAALAAAGLVTSAASPWHRAGACAGRPGCAKSLADVRADAAACLVADPGHRGPAGLPVYWSGCERRCGRPGGSWVDVLATADGYEVTVRAPRPAPRHGPPRRRSWPGRWRPHGLHRHRPGHQRHSRTRRSPTEPQPQRLTRYDPQSETASEAECSTTKRTARQFTASPLPPSAPRRTSAPCRRTSARSPSA
ncbi:hypothetical protein ACFQ2B_03650 [Streptomyces stramineus]